MATFRPSKESQVQDREQVQHLRLYLDYIEGRIAEGKPLPLWVQERLQVAARELGMSVSFLKKC